MGCSLQQQTSVAPTCIYCHQRFKTLAEASEHANRYCLQRPGVAAMQAHASPLVPGARQSIQAHAIPQVTAHHDTGKGKGGTIQCCCGSCASTITVEPKGNGLVEFQCPRCNTVNQVQYHGVAQVVSSQAPLEIPPWWMKTPSLDNSELVAVTPDKLKQVQELMNRTWKNVTTRDRAEASICKFSVVQVQQNHNLKLWTNYVRARDMIRAEMKPEDLQTAFTAQVQEEDNASFECLGEEEVAVNEFLLFHGSKPSAVENICRSEFMVKMAGANTGSLYGAGIYFGENSSKSDEYSSDESTGIYQGLYAMLLCRVTCGRMYYTDEVRPDHLKIEAACRGPRPLFHSVLGDRVKARGTYREFVVFNNDQAYPEYVIIYRREPIT